MTIEEKARKLNDFCKSKIGILDAAYIDMSVDLAQVGCVDTT